MNDKDSEAFEKWWYDFCFGDYSQSDVRTLPIDNIIKAWQAACDYKCDEYSNIMQAMTQTSQNNFKLQAENKKLRDALRFIRSSADCRNESEVEQCSHVAEEALRESNGDGK